MASTKSRRKQRTPELKVVFDTNSLWTGSANDLLKQELVEIIRTNSSHSDVSISWHLPDAVRHERQFQMLRQSLELLPSIQKLERLLGHNLNITEDIIQQRVQEAVERQIRDLGLNQLSLNISDVDWSSMILNAAYRRPPFALGEKEKGFRDAIIAEEFLQLVSASPVTPKVCRIALITNDGLLAEAVRVRTTGVTNIRILINLEELKGLINTLVSEVSEEFVTKILTKAKEYFFEPDQRECLYSKENVRDKITEQFGQQLRSTPKNADTRDNGTWYISSPRFLKKTGQRVFWASRIEVEAKAYKYVTREPSFPYIGSSQLGLSELSPVSYSPPVSLGRFNASELTLTSSQQPIVGFVESSPSFRVGEAGVRLFPLSSQEDVLRIAVPPSSKSLVRSGKTLFDVTWSVAVTTTGKFSEPRVESVEYIETAWE